MGKEHYIFFEHGPETPCVTLRRNEKARIAKNEVVDIEKLFTGKPWPLPVLKPTVLRFSAMQQSTNSAI